MYFQCTSDGKGGLSFKEMIIMYVTYSFVNYLLCMVSKCLIQDQYTNNSDKT